jgi:penicillin-insensitive murein endopeptidase
MLTRIIAASGIPFVLIAGGFSVADRIAVAQAPRAPEDLAAAVAPVPAAAPSAAPVLAGTAPAIPSAVTIPPLPPPAAVIALPAPPPAAAASPKPAPLVPATPAPAAVATVPPAQAPAAMIPLVPPKPVVLGNVPPPPDKPEIGEAKEPAGQLFSHIELPSLGKAMAIGYYPRGCLQGGEELPINGPNWQVMRVDRNRNWGHPELIKFLELFAPLAAKATGWKGVLIGDMAQPRGGPLPFGHLSHQIGLDVDIWFMPMPNHRLTTKERDTVAAINLVAPDRKHVNENWSPADEAFIRTAAEQPEVERVLVNPAIKKKMCEMEGKAHWSWMDKVRPWYGHNDHIHVRLKCPADSPHCRHQPPVPGGDGCGKSLDYWFTDRVLHPHITAPKHPPRALTLADLPPACKNVINAPANVKAAQQ